MMEVSWMEIEVKDEEKRVNIWLTRAESHDQALLESLKPIYKKYKDKKYLVAVFHSGKENMKESIRDLLIYNIYKKYAGKNVFVFHEKRFDYCPEVE